MPRSAGACGFVHDSRRWKNGQRRNIPPGAGSAEITAWSTPSRRSEYDDLEPAGSGADDDDRIVARRERAIVRGERQLRHRFAARSRRACDLEHPVHDPRVGDQERLDPRAGQDQAAQRSGRDDVGDRRLAEEDRDLAEEVAARQPGPLRAVDEDRRLAIEDDVEARAASGPGGGPVALGEGGLLEGVDDAFELRDDRSANSPKPAIASISSSRPAIARMVPRARRAVKRVSSSWRTTDLDAPGRAAQHQADCPTHTMEDRPDDPDPRPQDRAAGRRARCWPASMPDGLRADRRPGRRGRPSPPATSSPARARSGPGSSSIASGAVRVVRDGETIATLGPGDFFGELSVLDGRPRIAQVIADGADRLPGPRDLGLRGGRPRAAGRRAGASCAAWPAGCATLTEAHRH